MCCSWCRSGRACGIEPSGAPLEIESRAYRGALEVFGNARRTLDGRQRAAARGLSARRRAERAQPDRLRPDRSAQGAGRGRPHLHPAQPGPVQERGLRRLRHGRVSGLLRRADRKIRWRPRPSSRPAAWSPPTTASRSTRSTAPRAAAGPRTRKTSSTRRCRTWCRRAANTSIPSRCRSRRRDPLPIGRTACSPSPACRISPTPRASWACRTAASRRRRSPPPWRRSSGRRSTRRLRRRPICRSSPNRESCRRQGRCRPRSCSSG